MWAGSTRQVGKFDLSCGQLRPCGQIRLSVWAASTSVWAGSTRTLATTTTTTTTTTVDRYSAENQWSRSNVSANASTERSADSRSICRPSLGRYTSTDMSTDTSVESRSICRPRGAQNTHDPIFLDMLTLQNMCL